MTFWELEGAAWREGRHNGTQASDEGLSLVQGVSRGVWSRSFPAVEAFDRLVASLNPDPWPLGSGARLSVRLRGAEAWGPWRCLGLYGEADDLPRSEESPQVLTEVLAADAAPSELGVRLEVEAGVLGGRPLIRRLAFQGWLRGSAPAADAGRSPVWGTVLDVAPRSQRVLAPELRERVCSPTSVAMVLAFFGQDVPTEEVAAAAHDRGADVYGNWSFNVAWAGERGLRASVRRMRALADLEAEIAAGRPVVISHRYAEGELSDTPLPHTAGHLIVVVGFTDDGDVVVNDPAADPTRGESVRRVYRRAELQRSWLEKVPGGIAYTLEAR